MAELDDIASALHEVQDLLSTSFDKPIDRWDNAISILELFPSLSSTKTPYDQAEDHTAAFIRRAALAETAITSVDYPLATATDARELINALDVIFKREINWCFDNGCYNSAESLRSTLARLRRYITIESIKLPERTTYEFRESLPSLTLAYQLYGDANREIELLDSANAECPLFMPTKFEGNTK